MCTSAAAPSFANTLTALFQIVMSKPRRLSHGGGNHKSNFAILCEPMRAHADVHGGKIGFSNYCVRGSDGVRLGLEHGDFAGLEGEAGDRINCLYKTRK